MWHRYFVLVLQPSLWTKTKTSVVISAEILTRLPTLSMLWTTACFLVERLFTGSLRVGSHSHIMLSSRSRSFTLAGKCEILLEPLKLQDPSDRFRWVFPHVQMEEPHQILGKDSKTLPAGSHWMIQSDRQFIGTVSHWRTFGIGGSLGSWWDSSHTACRDFSSDSDGSRRISTQPSLQNALGFSWSLYLEPTTFRYRRKPSALSPAPSVHHACHTTVNLTLPGTAENKEAIWIDLIIIYLFILVGKKNNVQKRCGHFVFSSYFIFGLLSSSAYMSFMYILYDIFKAGSIVLLSAILWTGRYWLTSEQYAFVSRDEYPTSTSVPTGGRPEGSAECSRYVVGDCVSFQKIIFRQP